MQHAREGCEMHTKFWLVNLKGRVLSEYIGVNWGMISEWISEKCGVGGGSCRLDSSGSG